MPLSEIRTFTREDVPAVAELFQKTFRNPRKSAPPSLAAYLADVFLNHPWFDPEIASRVHVAAGKVTGFIGVFPSRLQFRGRLVSAAIAGSLMVADPDHDAFAGAKLLRSVVKGPQDITISETANAVSQALWEPLGGRVAPLLSMDWVHVLKPASAALAAVAERWPQARLVAPLGRGCDWLSASLPQRESAAPERAARVMVQRNAASDDFGDAVRRLSLSSDFGPLWENGELGWFLAHAERKERLGAVHRTVVRNAAGEPAGCHIYHGDPGGIARVLQVLTASNATEAVVDALFQEARQTGAAALRGRASPQLMSPLLKRRCVFMPRAATIFHTAEPALGEAIQSEGALVTGLAGESWTRLIGGEFTD